MSTDPVTLVLLIAAGFIAGCFGLYLVWLIVMGLLWCIAWLVAPYGGLRELIRERGHKRRMDAISKKRDLERQLSGIKNLNQWRHGRHLVKRGR